jgi:hypothetical protein
VHAAENFLCQAALFYVYAFLSSRYVFQDRVLFSNMTARENIGYDLKNGNKMERDKKNR